VDFANPQINLYAGGIEESLHFYHDVLGFAETFRIPKVGTPMHVELRMGSLTLGVATYEALQREHGISTGRGPPRMELVFFTEDVDGAYGWATSQGAPSMSAPHDFRGDLHSARVADPEGNPVGFVSRLPAQKSPDPTTLPTLTNHLINIYTRDMEKSLGFYRDLLGFAETFRVPRRGLPEHVELELGPLNLAVSTLDALKRHHGISGGGGPPRGEVVLWVADVDAALRWMNAQRVPTLSPPHNFAGVLRAAWVGDPDGNPVQIVARNASA
jgi:glyoxylase I family protein